MSARARACVRVLGGWGVFMCSVCVCECVCDVCVCVCVHLNLRACTG